MTPHNLGGVELPADVWWENEFSWSPVEQVREYAVTGALVVDLGERQAGRPITMTSNVRGGWVSRGTVKALRALADVAGATYTLTLGDGREFTVMFDLQQPFDASPLRAAGDMTDATRYRITLRLIEV